MTKISLMLGLLFAFSENSKTQELKTAIFAAGCFWCIQPPYEKLKGKGVISTRVGYSGGQPKTAKYELVSGGGTGHREVIEVVYDPKLITFDQLLDVFWVNTDPFDEKGQFCDKGEQYQSAVYYENQQEKGLIQKSMVKAKARAKEKGEFKTLILEKKPFFAAEDKHQDYAKRNPNRYAIYRYSCGRDSRLKAVWGG